MMLPLRGGLQAQVVTSLNKIQGLPVLTCRVLTKRRPANEIRVLQFLEELAGPSRRVVGLVSS